METNVIFKQVFSLSELMLTTIIEDPVNVKKI